MSDEASINDFERHCSKTPGSKMAACISLYVVNGLCVNSLNHSFIHSFVLSLMHSFVLFM
jgi:hypothetical protein